MSLVAADCRACGGECIGEEKPDQRPIFMVCQECDKAFIFFPRSNNLMLPFGIVAWIGEKNSLFDIWVHSYMEHASEWLQKWLHASNYSMASVLLFISWVSVILKNPCSLFYFIIVEFLELVYLVRKASTDEEESSDVINPLDAIMQRHMMAGRMTYAVILLMWLYLGVMDLFLHSDEANVFDNGIVPVLIWFTAYLAYHIADTRRLPPSEREYLFDNNPQTAKV